MPKAPKINVKEKVVDDNICDLSLCELKEIPVKEIVALKRVTVLDLSSNLLLSLGKNFTTLTRLVKLDLSKNQIRFLPDDFGLLRNLRHLDLYNNQLEHLPLSFGDLTNLRYLDLKGNPLTPALAKIVGINLTMKDCQESAKRTVRFMSSMQIEAIKAKEQYKQELLLKQNAHVTDEPDSSSTGAEQQKSKKAKKSKSKKKANNAGEAAAANKNSAASATLGTNDNITITKASKMKKSANGSLKGHNGHLQTSSSTALTSLIIFLLMVAFNVVLIYMIMFKNPEIAEKLVEAIPHQYRDWILTKTEIFRLRVTDWITEFRTPPEEH
uniref:Leucine-rich repeat-containing protein 59 n=1 Tax=Stomoxys calcitrans TaxID=35570 RepID=A0A1I8P5L6_STOCA